MSKHSICNKPESERCKCSECSKSLCLFIAEGIRERIGHYNHNKKMICLDYWKDYKKLNS